MWFVRNGTRVQGPFTEDQLRSMRRRGQFSPIHQVSLDRVRWESAASLVQMLDGPLPQWNPRPEPPPADRSDSSKEKSSATSTLGAWFLLDSHRQQIGPISADEIIRRIASRQVAGTNMVCKAGDTAWRRLADVPEFAAYAPSRSKALFWVFGATALLLLISATLLAIHFWGGGRKPDSDFVRGGRIQNLDNAEMLSDAVGLVQLCHRVKLPNGSIIEESMGHGSAFCVTPTGYMLTNRHVIEGLYADRELNIDLSDGKVIKAREDLVPVVFFKQLRCPATVTHTSSRFDFAILKVERNRPCAYFSLAAGDSHKLRTPVASVGFPGVASRANEEERAQLSKRFGTDVVAAVTTQKTIYLESQLLDAAFLLSVEDGRITKLDKESNGWWRITHAAKISRGNSGGPLVDQSGKVLGINTQMRRDLDVVGKDTIISDGTIYLAYSTGQFRHEIEEHITDKIDWRE
jgi:S1-C subfamily serine protease